jgi:Lar family restriction alleviation protein
MTDEELKPCPFCGSTDLHHHLEGTTPHPAWAIYCRYCGARSRYDDAGDHISAWNTRAVLKKKPPVDRKLLCAREAIAREPSFPFECTIVRAIELWEEGFGK